MDYEDREWCNLMIQPIIRHTSRFRNVRPPWNQTSTGRFALVEGFFVQMFSFKQSSSEGLSFWAAKFFHTRKPEGWVKLGKPLTGGLLEGQSLQTC